MLYAVKLIVTATLIVLITEVAKLKQLGYLAGLIAALRHDLNALLQAVVKDPKRPLAENPMPILFPASFASACRSRNDVTSMLSAARLRQAG